MLRLGKSLTKNANGNISPHATAKQIDTHAAAPQRGFTTKPGVAVTTAHPRKHGTKPIEPQRGSTSQMRFLGAGIKRCGTPLGFGVISVNLPRVHCTVPDFQSQAAGVQFNSTVWPLTNHQPVVDAVLQTNLVPGISRRSPIPPFTQTPRVLLGLFPDHRLQARRTQGQPEAHVAALIG